MGFDSTFGNFDLFDSLLKGQTEQIKKDQQERSKCCSTCKHMMANGICDMFDEKPKDIIPNYNPTFKCGKYDKKVGIFAKLAPCPCCNSDELKIVASTTSPLIWCRSCDIYMRNSSVHGNLTSLIKKWNKRPFSMNARILVEVPAELREGIDLND